MASAIRRRVDEMNPTVLRSFGSAKRRRVYKMP